MKKLTDQVSLCARADAHAALLETAAALLELDGIGLAPEVGHVHHLRRMAGAIRAQAALGQRAQTYTGGRYLPDPLLAAANDGGRDLQARAPGTAWH